MQIHGRTVIKTIFLWTILPLALSGCADGTHDFKIRFGDVHGLKRGDQVYLEESVIGAIEEIEYTDAGAFLVGVAIKEEFSSAATDSSKFFIDSDPGKSDQKLIRVVQLEKGGSLIEEDAIVDGQTKYAVLCNQFAHQLGKNIVILESGINEFLRELKDITEDEQVKQIEKQLDDIIADLGNMSDEMKRKFENEILPLLREKIEALRKSLESIGKQDDLEGIDRKMESITKTLRV